MPSSNYYDRWSASGEGNGIGRAAPLSWACDLASQDIPTFHGYGRHLDLAAGATFGLGGENRAQSMLVAVLDGVVKGCIEMASGQRLIIGFRFAGDMLIIPESEQHLFLMIEALTPAKVQRLGDRDLSRLRDEHPQLDLQLWTASNKELSRITQHMLRLGCMDAKARVASFLLEMRNRLTVPGSNRASLWLPMARQDIAEYLGLKPETVSRQFSRLRAAGIIDTPAPKHVVIKDRRRLLDLAGLGDSVGCKGLD